MSRASPTEPPLVAGKYHLRDRMGQGAHGTVYRATHVDLGEDVAIKILNPDVADDEKAQRRFLREVKLATSFVHKYAVQIRDFGREPNMDCLYFTMDLIKGPTLEEVLEKEGSIDARPAIHLVGQLLEALEEAHRAGIVHRDLKPANLILTSGPDGEAEVRILDFGVAKAVSESRKDAINVHSALTMTGTLVGTLPYMSPEQAQGMEVDARADLYTVGVILYELLSGRKPIQADPKATSPLQSFLFRLTTVAPKALTKYAPHVGPELEAVIMKALRKGPKDRWPSAKDMRKALKKVPTPKSKKRRPRRPSESGTGTLSSRTRSDRATVVDKPRQDRARAQTEPRPKPRPGSDRARAKTRPKTEPRPRPKSEPRSKTRPKSEATHATRARPPAETARPTPRAKTSGRKTDSHSKRTRKAGNLPSGIVPGPRKGEFLNEQDGSLLVWVPPGTYARGTNRPGEADKKASGTSDHPAHEVTLTRGFFLGKTPVTWKQYRKFCVKTGRNPPTKIGFGNKDIPITDKHPAVMLSWNEVQAYCRWAKLRLPTEAEWELAARGTDGRAYPWGAEHPSPKLLNYAKHPIFGGKATSPVGTFTRGVSPCGCLDMCGNVWEWVSDWYGDYRKRKLENPTGPRGGSARVIRGGCWGSEAKDCEASRRFALAPHKKKNFIGFRVARSG